jgi:ribosomal protein S18 acetylase RimI-like enzyme
MHIRRANEEDIPRLDDLLYQVHRVHSTGRPDIFRVGNKKYTSEELVEILKNDSTPVFVAEGEDGRVIGYAFCIYEEHCGERSLMDRKTLYIDDLCVDEARRGQHVGRALYEAAVELARACGCYNLTLNVWSCNPTAMRFYESCGLLPQKVCMEKIL